ncbi:MAG: DNA polymerase I [Bdellovibrionales bacterium]|nr:DNA polymerase I [Bdellovibrionales bacterium]
MKTSYNTLYLVDISSFIFRAFYAVRELTAPDGTPVNAVYGVATMLQRLMDEADPKFLAVVYDSKEPSFRKIKYPEYKANRSAPPEMLLPQFDIIEELVNQMGIPSFRQSGVEADDLIATLNRVWKEGEPKHRVVIVSGDKDLMALVDSKTQVWDTMKEVHYTPHEVIEKFGVEPSQVRDYLAMVGDSSDNIPGITGIGPKGATQLLTEFKTLEGVIRAAKEGKVKGKKGEQIVEGEKLAILSQELATLKEDIELKISADQARFEFKVHAGLLEFCKRYNFKSLFSKYSSRGAAQDAPPIDYVAPALISRKLEWKTISSKEALSVLISEMKKAGNFAFDTETTSLDPRAARLVGIAIATNSDGGYYIPVGHELQLDSKIPQLDESYVLDSLKPLLESAEFGKIGQNLKYDLRVMRANGVTLLGIRADTMVAAYALDSSGRHNLDFLSKKYLDYDVKTYESVTGKGASQISFSEVSIEEATKYSAEDAWCAFALWDRLRPELERAGVEKLFYEVDLPMVEVVADMEDAGIKVDVPFLKSLEAEFEADLKGIEQKVQAYTKNPGLNLNSPKQLATFLFEELNLPTQAKTRTGFSTDAAVLEALAPLHPAPKLLLEYREISKLKGTYVLPLQELRDKKDSRIRTSFHLTGTATGRLSSSDPNLQNIPVRSKRGQKIRQAFIAEEGSVLLSADYSQIELRILAHMSGDPVLVESFKRGEDVHRRTASEIFHKTPPEVSDQERSFAKAINFGLMYGKTVFGLAEELHISRSESKKMIDQYFARYAGVKQFLDEQVARARDLGFVTTLLGRKRALPEIRSSNPAIRANAERMAMNSPIQGTASDLIKMAMVKLHRELKTQKLRSKILLQVHDELVLECPKSEVEAVSALITRVMESALTLAVPLKVNVGTGSNWAEL